MADETSPAGATPGITEKVWAVLGLAAALILAAISIDLLIGSKPSAGPAGDGAPAGGDPGDCGC